MNAAIILANGFEEVEGLMTVDILRRAGITVDMASIMGRLEIESSHKVKLTTDILAEEADLDSYDMVFLPGGMPGTNHLKASKTVTDAVMYFYNNDKYLAAICAAPTVFGGLGILKGKKACCYGGMEDGLIGAEVSFDNVCKDGKIFTSRGLGTALDMGLALLEEFKGTDAANEMAAKIMLK